MPGSWRWTAAPRDARMPAQQMAGVQHTAESCAQDAGVLPNRLRQWSSSVLTGVPAHMLVDNHSVSSTLVCRRDAVCAYLNVVAFAGAGDSEVPQGCASTVVQVDWTLLEWRIVQTQPSTVFHLYRRFSFGCAQQFRLRWFPSSYILLYGD